VSRKIEQLASQQDAEPQTENDFSSTILNESSALQIDDVDKSVHNNAVLSERDQSHHASTIDFDQDNDTSESLLVFKDQSDSHEMIATTTSIVDEKIEVKKSTPSTEFVSTSKPDVDDNSDAALIEFSKKSIEPVEPSESLTNSICDVTVMASHSDHAEDSGVTFTGHTPSSVPSDYRSGYSSTHAASARENLAGSTYVSTDNPLFQIQRDRAVEAQVIAALKAGRDEVRLSLYPPQLGQVTINLALDGHKVKVALKTSSREATDLLTSEQPSLTHALHLEGFSLEGFDVTEDGPQDNHKEDRDHTIITPIPALSGSSEFSIDITI
jgi:flagellar hook-length control protein FliK